MRFQEQVCIKVNDVLSWGNDKVKELTESRRFFSQSEEVKGGQGGVKVWKMLNSEIFKVKEVSQQGFKYLVLIVDCHISYTCVKV